MIIPKSADCQDQNTRKDSFGSGANLYTAVMYLNINSFKSLVPAATGQ